MTDKVCLSTGGGRRIGAAVAHDDLDVGKFADLAALERIGKVEEQAKTAAFLLTDFRATSPARR
ncbi:hypothetical protein LJR255_003107 [Pararhizobium sp. LjRoot255]|uniref:hypothetical protein n=1 Tax=Pararhizobium sp. LjRoot255 TaxID=3342298 RepID=UPI003ECCD5B6